MHAQTSGGTGGPCQNMLIVVSSLMLLLRSGNAFASFRSCVSKEQQLPGMLAVYPSDLPSECTIRADSFLPALFEGRLGRRQARKNRLVYLILAEYRLILPE